MASKQEMLEEVLRERGVSEKDYITDIADLDLNRSDNGCGPLRELDAEEVILVTGGNSLLGQHLIRHIYDSWTQVKHIKTLDTSLFQWRMDGESAEGYEKCGQIVHYQGSIVDREVLREVLGGEMGVTTVIHLQEVRDLSILPDKDLMWNINVEGTKTLLEVCEEMGVSKLVHGSSMLVMMSSEWPSVYNPETADLPPPKERLFPHYCNSKLEAERLVLANEKMQTFVVRQCLMYGEGDKESSVYSSILKAKDNNDTLPTMGDGEGVIQYAYAGNVALGVVSILKKMDEDKNVTKEVIFLPDNTPTKGFYTIVEPFLVARGMKLAEKSYPWFLLYIPYTLFEKMITGIHNLGLVDVKGLFSESDLPSSNYLMVHYYFWYFFSGFKASHFLQYTPKFSYEEAVERSIKYYNTL